MSIGATGTDVGSNPGRGMSWWENIIQAAAFVRHRKKCPVLKSSEKELSAGFSDLGSITGIGIPSFVF